jgi:hypothetical protein
MAQDPGIQDSMIFGNFDGSIMLAGLNTQLVIPVYIKTDDSVIFVHWPMATDDAYIAARNGGAFFPPLSLWDDRSFLSPNANSPVQGYTSQSILGFAYLFDPRDPQNFLHTNSQWRHVADYFITTTSDISVLGDTTALALGVNPNNGDLYMGTVDFLEIRPAVIWGQIYFPPNTPPVFVSPDTGTTPVNEQFGACFTVTATDADADEMVLTVNFGPTDYIFNQIQDIPGLISYNFCWVPDPGESGTYPLSFIVNDGNGGVIQRNLTLIVSPAGLVIGDTTVVPGATISLPVILDNQGSSSAVGGFEILVSWSPQALSLNGVIRGGRTGSFEFFRVNMENVGDGFARIVGLADLRNGVVSPPLQPGIGPIFFLEMSVVPDENLIGVELPVSFLNIEQTDNTLSDSTGYLLVHPQLTNGTVSVIGPGDVQIGDINMNGHPYEIGDATLFVNHLTNPVLFPFNSIQREASDVNVDGIPETVADLVYLINRLVENSAPRLDPSNADFMLIASADNDNTVISARSIGEIGAVLVKIAHQSNVTIEPISDGQFTLAYHDDGSALTILAYMPSGGGVAGDNAPLFTLNARRDNLMIVELQASDADGRLLEASYSFDSAMPERFSLAQNYPNPFNATTRISFGLPLASDVRLDVYSVTGQKVTTLLDSRFEAGWYDVNWDGADKNGRPLASGIYFYRLQTSDNVISMKMTLLK